MGRVPHDSVLATALVDRLLHHGEVYYGRARATGRGKPGRRHGDETHTVPALEQGEADGDAEVSITQARPANENQRTPLDDEALVEIAEEELAVEFRAEAEVELLEGSSRRGRRRP